MTIRIGINGFGRIGRTVTRILLQRDDFEIVAINDLTGTEDLAHALKYDSVYPTVPSARADGDYLIIDGMRPRVTAHRDLADLEWGALGVDYVVESTGIFKKRAQLEQHLSLGADKVFLSVPPKDAIDAVIVMGVNDDALRAEHQIISNASCTTNAAAPLTKVIHDAFTIRHGLINTIHAYTNGQHLVDAPGGDRRRSRAAALSVIPTTTGAAKAVAKVIPSLTGKLDGMAYRVPVPVGSIVDMVFEVERDVTVEEVNQAVRSAAMDRLKGILAYQDEPIVSVDIIGDSHSSIFDALITQVMQQRMVKVASWYDNEWGYSCRLVDLMARAAELSN
jgi:glyceraldehyde 3-phosphate dehydrogenase